MATVPDSVAGEGGARAEWAQHRERGSASTLRLMTAISLRLGRRASRCVLPLIVAYFMITATAARRASKQYLRRALGRVPRLGDGYRHVHSFASVIHDRLFLINDRFDLFDIEVEGAECITELLARKRGAFLVGAHFGSFEVMRALARANLKLDVVMVMYEENARKISAALAAVNPAARQDIVALGHAESMLQVRRRLDEGAIVGVLADRTFGDDTTVPVTMLGDTAWLPTGPFRMAALLRRPVIFMAGLYLGGNRYRIRFEPLADFTPTLPEERVETQREAIERFAQALDRNCREAPYNWFNFFDFWAPAGGIAPEQRRR
jgi:predicted LPLAT superfamily acyltransferase